MPTLKAYLVHDTAVPIPLGDTYKESVSATPSRAYR